MMGWMAPLRHLGAKVLVGESQSADKEPSMNEMTTVGLDLVAFFSELPRCLKRRSSSLCCAVRPLRAQADKRT